MDLSLAGDLGEVLAYGGAALLIAEWFSGQHATCIHLGHEVGRRHRPGGVGSGYV